MKKYILFFIAAFAVITVNAQSGYNYQELGVGFDASYIRGYTNITRQYDHPAFNVNFIYNYNPYIPISAEIQIGQLSGGGTTVNLDPYGRMYTNNYKALIFHGDFQLGAGINYEDSWILQLIKNFYGGTGFGFIDNANKVQRTNVIAANGPFTYVFPGKDNSINIMIPFRFGYEIRFFDSYGEPSSAIDIGYIHNIAFGSGLDGYNDPRTVFKHDSQDQYRQIVIGFKYYFGTVVSYNKLIRTF